ncbi:MAG: hypothetical protein ACREF4_03040 [Gammaproteobacteria bacterium]
MAGIVSIAFIVSPSLAGQWGGSGSRIWPHAGQGVVAQAQADPLCDVVQRNANGSWTVVKPFVVESSGPGVTTRNQLSPGQTFGGGAPGMTTKVIIGGIDLLDRLEKNCRK